MTSQQLRLFTNFITLIRTELDLDRITSGFHRALAKGVACQQGTLTLPDTWLYPPLWELLICSNCWEQFSRNCRVFLRLKKSGFSWYFLEFPVKCYTYPSPSRDLMVNCLSLMFNDGLPHIQPILCRNSRSPISYKLFISSWFLKDVSLQFIKKSKCRKWCLWRQTKHSSHKFQSKYMYIVQWQLKLRETPAESEWVNM